MAGYTKLFSSIVTSTIWCEDAYTRVVWVAMLAMKDRDGLVEGSIPGFARVANVTVEQMERAVKTLSEPDPHSRTPDNEGRRIEHVPGGWRVLNHEAYRAMESVEHRRERDADRQRRHRLSRPVTKSHAPSPHTDAYAYTETETKIKEVHHGESGQVKTHQDAKQGPSPIETAWTTFWVSYPRKTAKQAASRAFQKLAPNQELLETMLKALEMQKKQESWIESPRFIPHPSSWLNGKRWEDQIITGGTNGRRPEQGKRITGYASHQPGKYDHLG